MDKDNELEKLKAELRRQEEQTNFLRSKIRELKDEKMSEDKNLYQGKWFYKSADWWDDGNIPHPSYEIVYVKNVLADLDGYLSVIIIGVTHYSSLMDFSIEVDDCYSINSLKDKEEMTIAEFSDLDDMLVEVLRTLQKLRPALFGN